MNVLMQLRKVCNHPDLFDSRDYVTPSKQKFQIFFVVPTCVLHLLTYDPLKSINLKSLSLILEDFEKLSKFDYLSMLKNFPLKPFFEVINQIIESNKNYF